MAWDKELEAKKILAKEKEVHVLFRKHKDGSTPTRYEKIGYCKESTMQSDFFQWAVNSYLDELQGFLLHIPNEGDTAGEAGAIKGGIRLAMGVVAGAPDFLFVGKFGRCCFAELKIKGEKISPNQKTLHTKWARKGSIIPVIDSFEEWRTWIEWFCLEMVVNNFKELKYGI